jgi:hypothetical protein
VRESVDQPTRRPLTAEYLQNRHGQCTALRKWRTRSLSRQQPLHEHSLGILILYIGQVYGLVVYLQTNSTPPANPNLKRGVHRRLFLGLVDAY